MAKGAQRKDTVRPETRLQSHSYRGAWQGKASSGRLGDGTGPVQLSSSAQGMRSGEGWARVQPLSYPPAECQKGESRQWVQGAGDVPSNHFCGGQAPFPSRVWAGPSRQGNITRQSSHPLALHLLALLPPHLPLPPLLRSHWGRQPLPGIWDRNRRTSSSPFKVEE